MIKRYEPNWDDTNSFTMEKDKEGEYVLYKDIKHLIERSDNSDYAAPPTAPPKLPSFDEVEEYINTSGHGLVPNDYIKRFYDVVKKLGNFA